MIEITFDSIGHNEDDRSGTAVTVGTFDGVHIGHHAVIRALIRSAKERELTSSILTFEPHPLRVVRPEAAPARLTTAEEKRELLIASGAERIIVLNFTPALAALSAREFVERVLVDKLEMRHLVIGHDHGFGRGRGGDASALRKFGAELDFDVESLEAVIIDGEPISSTRIRNALENAELDAAAKGLGRPYSVRGTVVRGEGEGRELGFPTANLEIEDPRKLIPKHGVYAARATLEDGEHVKGVLHLGPRPTYHDRPDSVELHIFDFDREIYGEDVDVQFCGWIREIRAFESEAELVEAVHSDSAHARSLLESREGACGGRGSELR